MTLRTALAFAVWGVPAALLACGGDKDADSGDVGNPPADELQVIDLGSVAVSDTGDFTGELTVDVPEGASSVMAYCGGYGDPNLGKLWYLTDPGGSKVYDADAPGTNYRSDWLDDMATALVPESPQTAATAGSWLFDFWIGAGNPGSVDCSAVIRLDEPGNEANILVDLVFVGLDGLDATTAPDDANFQDVLAQFEAEWNSGGLKPTFNYVDFGGNVAQYTTVEVTDDDYSEFNDLLRTSNPANDRTITFFLVQEIVNTDGGATILGLSAGPPGAAATHGTSKSGVIVSAIDIDSTPTDVAKIMAHEGGHFLGLYHTTEKDGTQFDVIGDTPECPASNDADANGTMNSSECAGMGAENVMWWTLTSGTATMSSDQGWVVRRNPVAD